MKWLLFQQVPFFSQSQASEEQIIVVLRVFTHFCWKNEFLLSSRRLIRNSWPERVISAAGHALR